MRMEIGEELVSPLSMMLKPLDYQLSDVEAEPCDRVRANSSFAALCGVQLQSSSNT